MAKQVAIAISVSKSGGLVPLPGATAGAQEFATWARKAGFDVLELTDSQGQPVTATDVVRTVKSCLDRGDVERLIIFFAGHGVATGLDTDHWLLTDAANNANEAINVAASLRLARRSGIPHVVVIADACRTMTGKEHLGIVGATVFPRVQSNQTVELDQFYASVSGDPAYEITPEDKLLKSHGLFTQAVLEALRGEAADACESVDGGTKPLAVTSRKLRDFLTRTVPLRASRLDLQQIPDCVPASYWPPNVIAWAEPQAAAASLPPAPARRGPVRATGGKSPEALESDTVDIGAAGDAIAVEAAESVISIEPVVRKRMAAVGEVAPLLTESGRDHFETGSGLSIFGARPLRFAVAGHVGELFEEGPAWHVRGQGKAGSIAIELEDGRVVATALLPEFIGTIHIGESGVDLVSYQAPVGSRFAEDPDDTRHALAELGAATRSGFRDWAVGEAEGIADSFRKYKHQNPTFGILAAYAYDRAGRTDQVRDMIDYFKEADQIVPFDVALLADIEPDARNFPVAPMFPLVTQGWAYLEPEVTPAILQEIRGSLLPSVWTTLESNSGRVLFHAVAEGELP